MDVVNLWLSTILAACGVVAAVAALLRWWVGALVDQLDDRIRTTVEVVVDETFDRKFDEKFSKGFDEKFGGAVQPIYQRLDGIDARLAGIDRRLDGIDTRIDHVSQVLDLRIRPIEADMALVKQRLLGTPAA